MSVSVCALYKHVPKKLRKKALVPLKLELEAVVNKPDVGSVN